MNAHSRSLFRPEALRHREERLHGSVTIATPVAWQVIGFLLFIALIATAIFLSVASYSRIERVSGVVALDRGVATIIPTRAGVIERVLVAEGQPVLAGEKLAIVRAEESMIGGATGPERITDAIEKQDAQLADQRTLLLRASMADQQRLRAQISGDLAAITTLESQIADQKRLIASAQADFDNSVEVAARGYISKRDMDQRQATILTRRQQLAQLEQSLSDKRAQIAEAQWALAQSAMSAQAQAAGAQSTRASLSQQRVQTDLARGYALTSPVDGVVTALTVRLGQPVAPEQQLMAVVPSKSQPRVELYVPTTAAGFIAPGQEVRLSVDAFPYQTFGTIQARILTISRSTIARQTQGGAVPVYLVTAAMPQPWVKAFGRRQPLLPGMTLSARIVTEKRSLIGWLFDPLFAVRSR
jgi:membrane fusion protein